MVITRNMVTNQVQEETANNQMEPMEMIRRMERQMDEMQRKWEEEIKALRVENEIIRQEKGSKGPILNTLTLSRPDGTMHHK